MQKYVIFFLFLLHSVVFSQNNVQKSLDNFTKLSFLKNASIGFKCIDLNTNTEIASLNASIALPPASTTKLFTTATALELLPKDLKPATRFYVEGTITEGVINGNLWIRGGGDVSLGSAYFNKPGSENAFLGQWVDTLQKLGIKKINGSIYVDGSEFGYKGTPEGWGWSDIGNYYGAGHAGICIYDNALKYKFSTSKVAGGKTTLLSTFPIVPALNFKNYIVSSNINNDQSYVYGAPYSYERFGTGSLPLNKEIFTVKGSLPDPEYQLAQDFTAYLKQKGIAVNNGFKTVRTNQENTVPNYAAFHLIYTHFGNSILDIATIANQKSVNLFAEGLLGILAYQQTGNGETEVGIEQVIKYWSKKIDVSGLQLHDGSGLSRSNGISASHFCALLKEMYTSKNYTSFLNTLPIAGKSGTIASLCKNQLGEGRIYAKSGTISKIKSYVGYVYSTSGKKIAFAITVNNYTCNNAELRQQIEYLLNEMAVY
ncbi:MAG: D-alanyl-D-alanine carboxypeptidase/D-alanyl-D-alanine-endopeptidase [Crocinitomicaceae bacterium]|nr:D-alanyl-D-alanine carboxypeptidase/D-alanyl-D-alanine-endopeptidase [Crocinitomicaceae bacterium]